MLFKIKTTFFYFLIILNFPLFGQKNILNLDVAKKAVRNYYESGAYYKNLNKIIKKAEDEISSIKLPSNAAVIFDIDDTALSSYDYTKSMGFGFTFQSWYKWIKQGRAKAILPVRRFYHFLINKGIKVIFLTGRIKDLCPATKKNLIREGYTKFDTLICREKQFSKLTAAEFKLNLRKLLSQKGYNIIATIGDQQSDVTGQFTGIKIKLPNLLYIIK